MVGKRIMLKEGNKWFSVVVEAVLPGNRFTKGRPYFKLSGWGDTTIKAASEQAALYLTEKATALIKKQGESEW